MASRTPLQPDLLTSWKEIANYLGKGVRTVQRWELQFGLPVRRPNEKVKGIVHATRQELDTWLEMQWSQRSSEENHNHNQFPVSVHSEQLKAVRANIQNSSRLRAANRMLISDIRASVNNMFRECQCLARNLTCVPKDGVD